ncbi:MAG: glycosyltransferase [Terriglobales bacterium]|jgi:glycosyltransferase involved in cell wall biosynthesis
METPLITIGMTVRNCAPTIGPAIASLIGQTFRNWELLIIDDGSGDDTMAVARSFNDPRVFAISTGEVILDRGYYGVPVRLNQAVALARGKYFARMDGDDIAYPERLEKQVHFLDLHPEIDLLATAVIVFRENGRLIGHRPTPNLHADICKRPHAGFPMPHPTWMGRTEWFRNNPYRADAHRMEDKELLFRTHARSRFACLNEPLLAYRETSLSVSKIAVARTNFIRVLARNAGRLCTVPDALFGVLGQIARLALDLTAVSTGLNYRLLPHRARPASRQQARRWQEVWAGVSAASTL